MIVDLLLAVVVGVYFQSLFIFCLLIVLAGAFARLDRPWSSGLLRFAIVAAGVSILFSGFGCDCDGDWS